MQNKINFFFRFFFFFSIYKPLKVGVNNFLFDGDQLNTRSNLKMATGSLQNVLMWELM